MTHVAVIGGGASGVLLAAHLLRDNRPGLLVTIVEQRDELGAGIAYSTNDPDHLLNVRAANMSAFSDQPEHFFQWLSLRVEQRTTLLQDFARRLPGARRTPPFEGTSFAPRHLYREYLSSLLAPHYETGRLQLIRARAVALSESGDGVTVRFESGESIAADHAVLATGNEGPKLPPAPWRYDGWSSTPVPNLPADAPVAIVGTGLTMVDWVLTLLHGGHTGSITALSPRGLLPQAHRITGAVRLDETAIPSGASLSRITHWLRSEIRRAEAEGGDWRSVIDALRPHTQRLWQALSNADKSRFLRHARPWWDQHRHRVAPDAAEKLKAAEDRGQFRILAGRVRGFEERDGGVDVVLTRRGTQERRALFARAVFECRGRADNVDATENPLIRALLATGQARPDPLHLGLDVTSRLALIGRTGHPSQALSAIGPVTSGVFWEVTAVPDIRVQAAHLAQTLLSSERAS